MPRPHASEIVFDYNRLGAKLLLSHLERCIYGIFRQILSHDLVDYHDRQYRFLVRYLRTVDDPLVAPPAIAELLKVPLSHPSVATWTGNLLWISALCGGVFGLLGGWLIDRLGRKTVMAASIFLYSFSPFLAAFSTSLPWFISFAARPSSVCASSSSPPLRGWPKYSKTRSSARSGSGSRKLLHRSVACW